MGRHIRLRLLPCVAVLSWLMLVTVGAQPASTTDDEPRYDPSAIQVYRGTVIAVTTQTGSGGKLRTRVVMTTREGIVHVSLGPGSFLAERKLRIAAGDFLTVSGSRVRDANDYLLLAREVIKGTDMFLLRSGSGRPLWDERYN